VGPGDHRLRQLAPAPAHAQVDLGLARHPLLGAGLVEVVPPEARAAGEELVDVAAGAADVVAGGEVVARAGEDDDFHLVVGRRRGEGVVERVGHRRVLGVAVLRPVHRHHLHRAALLRQHHLLVTVLVAHTALPSLALFLIAGIPA